MQICVHLFFRTYLGWQRNVCFRIGKVSQYCTCIFLSQLFSWKCLVCLGGDPKGVFIIEYLSYPLKQNSCCVKQLTDWSRGWSVEERQKYHQVWGLWPEQVGKRINPQDDLKSATSSTTTTTTSTALSFSRNVSLEPECASSSPVFLCCVRFCE